MRKWLAALLLILTLLPGLAQAQTYRWVDEAGAVHYSQGIASIPERYRSRAELLAVEPPPTPPTLAEKRQRPPSSHPASARWKPSGSLPEITRISFPSGSRIVVSAKINGQGPVTLLLDTGSRATWVNPKALERLGISDPKYVCRSCEFKLRGGTTVKGDEVQVLSVEVGEAKLAGPAFVKYFERFASLGADGILGRNFLDNFTVTIDPRQRLLTLTPSTSGSGEREPRTPAAQSTRIPFPPYREILVSAKINGQGPVTLLLDTGAATTWVTTQALRGLGISITNAGYSAREGIGGKVWVWAGVVRVASVEVGEAKVGPLLINAFDEARDPDQGEDGLLGLDFLNRFTVTIDPSEGVATLTATPDSEE